MGKMYDIVKDFFDHATPQELEDMYNECSDTLDGGVLLDDFLKTLPVHPDNNNEKKEE